MGLAWVDASPTIANTRPTTPASAPSSRELAVGCLFSVPHRIEIATHCVAGYEGFSKATFGPGALAAFWETGSPHGLMAPVRSALLQLYRHLLLFRYRRPTTAAAGNANMAGLRPSQGTDATSP